MKYLVKNTKIVSTFGPSITLNLKLGFDRANPDTKALVEKVKGIIGDLFFAGVNCVRYNFSHGLHDENKVRMNMIHEVYMDIINKQSSPRRYLRPMVGMADTKGPEIRVFDMGSGVNYSIDQKIVIDCLSRKQGGSWGFSVVDSTGTYNMANDCKVGNSILVEDGKLTLDILSVDKELGTVNALVKNSHFLKTNKRINLPGADYSMDFLSEKDISDIKYALDNGFEFVALSFANSKKDVESVRNLINSYCKEKNIPNIMKIYSKIETLISCRNIEEIIDSSDGIMIARGDLGLEIPYYEVPYWTKQIIRMCRHKRKPVITATQMLDSLERNIVATRAEVSDVYRAAEMGSDCTMLSGETAQGMFPALAVKTMTNIVFESEKHFNTSKFQKFFKENYFSSLSERTKNLLSRLPSLDRNTILLVNYSDVDEEFISAFSAMRTPSPMFMFVPVSDISLYAKDPNWSNSDYLLMKQSSLFSLHRGIYPVFVDGDKSVSLNQMFSEFFNIFVGTTSNFNIFNLNSDNWINS